MAKVAGLKVRKITGPGEGLRRRGGVLRGDPGTARSRPGDVVVIRGEGPVGGPGMREMLSVTAALVGPGAGRDRSA